MTDFQKNARKITTTLGAIGLAFNAAGCSASRSDGPDGQNRTAPQIDLRLESAVAPAVPARSPAGPGGAEESLRFYNLHTDESTSVIRRRGQSISDAVNTFMRDYRRNEKADMSPKLFDLLQDLQGAIKTRHPGLQVTFQVVSSYRARATNAALRAAGGTQAEDSQHIHGNAMDIRVPGLPLEELRDIATCLKGGGVGYYETDGFVHVDVARVRYWPSHDYLKNLKCPTAKM